MYTTVKLNVFSRSRKQAKLKARGLVTYALNRHSTVFCLFGFLFFAPLGIGRTAVVGTLSHHIVAYMKGHSCGVMPVFRYVSCAYICMLRRALCQRCRPREGSTATAAAAAAAAKAAAAAAGVA